jgi:hypothetical protein
MVMIKLIMQQHFKQYLTGTKTILKSMDLKLSKLTVTKVEITTEDLCEKEKQGASLNCTLQYDY